MEFASIGLTFVFRLSTIANIYSDIKGHGNRNKGARLANVLKRFQFKQASLLVAGQCVNAVS